MGTKTNGEKKNRKIRKEIKLFEQKASARASVYDMSGTDKN
jgi:hypothetical protein